ncbi:MAG: hypothetical protein HY756_02175 [Nitrospirae bacterium]|nr:hypothetical protein [Nitrospirota bacterium]
MDKETREYLEGLKNEIIKSSEDLKRHTSVVYEEFQKRIEVFVEGYEVLDRKIDDLKEEITFELKEIRAIMKTLFKDLDHRLKVLERIKS